MPREAGSLLFLLILGIRPAPAHDLWIEPASFTVTIPTLLEVRLRIGDGFRGEAVSILPERIEKFSLWGKAGEAPVFARPGDPRRGLVRISERGPLLLGYRSKPSAIALEPEKFERYLAEEGLERIIDLRRERGETGRPGREIYTRHAKALILGKDPDGDPKGFDRILGFSLEIIPLADPRRLRAEDGGFPIRVLFRGRPIAGLQVTATRKAEAPGAAAGPVSGRSDAGGRVTFRGMRPGIWLIAAVHMTESEDPSAEWESHWASLTFEIEGVSIDPKTPPDNEGGGPQ